MAHKSTNWASAFCTMKVVDKHGNPCYNIRADVDVELTIPPGLDTGMSTMPRHLDRRLSSSQISKMWIMEQV